MIGVASLVRRLISGLLKQSDLDVTDITGSVHHEASVARVKERLGISTTLDNRQLTKDRDIILIAVKPQNMDKVLREIADQLNPTSC